MKITIITGSHRKESQSLKVGNYISDRIKFLNLFEEVKILDLAVTNLPFWNEDVWNDTKEWNDLLSPINAEINQSDAFIIISPEWGGMVPSKLKNLLLLLSSDVAGHKPALIVSVSSGLGGSYPINELRTSGYKNTKICYLPEHLIVRKVEECLNNEPNLDSEYDNHIRPRVDYVIKLLKIYSTNFKEIRNTEFNFSEYPFGM